jgi:hypothetical protein
VFYCVSDLFSFPLLDDFCFTISVCSINCYLVSFDRIEIQGSNTASGEANEAKEARP